MLKNKKGFTLVELLAIVVILAIIMVLAAPSMTKQIAKKEETDQTILDEKISNAAKIYAAKYYSEKIVNCTYTNRDNPCVAFNLNDLEQDGLINLKDKCSKKDSDGNSYSIDKYCYSNPSNMKKKEKQEEPSILIYQFLICRYNSFRTF